MRESDACVYSFKILTPNLTSVYVVPSSRKTEISNVSFETTFTFDFFIPVATTTFGRD